MALNNPGSVLRGLKVALCLMGAALGGCNGVPKTFISNPVYDQAFIVTSGAPMPMMIMATAVQWNDDYAVTAKHTPFLKNVVHEGRGDLVFFRHRADYAPQWRQHVPGESVTAVGFNSLYLPVEGAENTTSALVRLGVGDNVFYSIHDGATMKGMSGGPVFAGDGKVVGMTVAFIPKGEIDSLKRPDLAKLQRVSVFMPYSEIDRDWRRYQQKLAGFPAPASQPAFVAATSR